MLNRGRCIAEGAGGLFISDGKEGSGPTSCACQYCVRYHFGASTVFDDETYRLVPGRTAGSDGMPRSFCPVRGICAPADTTSTVVLTRLVE